MSFDLDGGTFTRRRPFFKMRQWRSLAEPSLVTREAANLVNGRDYTADVKPLTRAWSCSDAGLHHEHAARERGAHGLRTSS